MKLAISPIAPSQRVLATLLPTSLPLTPGPRLRLHPAGVERSPKLHLRGLTVRVLFPPAKRPCLAQAGPRQVATIPTLFP